VGVRGLVACTGCSARRAGTHSVQQQQPSQRRLTGSCSCSHVHSHSPPQGLAHDKHAPLVNARVLAHPGQHCLAIPLYALLLWLPLAGAIAPVVPQHNVGAQQGAQAVRQGQPVANVASIGVAQHKGGRLGRADAGWGAQQPGMQQRAVRGGHKGLCKGQPSATAPLGVQGAVKGRAVVLHATASRVWHLRVVQHLVLVAPQVVHYHANQQPTHQQHLAQLVHKPATPGARRSSSCSR
jgi:hypothetical protein